MQRAMFQEVSPDGARVICGLCPHNCSIVNNNTGVCKVRKNVDGTLYSLVYSLHSSVGVDPIEKKPLYHFYPGRDILSFGTFGCNLSCSFCQNWQISQSGMNADFARKISPVDAVKMARAEDSVGIAYTYNEPFINYEWVLETSKLAREAGLKNVLVTNGYVSEPPLYRIIPYIDAANIDVKSFRDEFYKKHCSGKLAPVIMTAEVMWKAGVHIELTNLLVPGENDSLDEISDMVDWISSIDVYIPLHFSRYFPNYNFSRPQTPGDLLLKARGTALKKLKYVFLGNIISGRCSDTFCPECGGLLISRTGFEADAKNIKGGRCEKCQTPLENLKIKGLA